MKIKKDLIGMNDLSKSLLKLKRDNGKVSPEMLLELIPREKGEREKTYKRNILLISDYLNIFNVEKLSAKYKLKEDYIRVILSNKGISIRLFSRPEVSLKLIVKFLDEGKSVKEIANFFKIKEEKIMDLINKHLLDKIDNKNKKAEENKKLFKADETFTSTARGHDNVEKEKVNDFYTEYGNKKEEEKSAKEKELLNSISYEEDEEEKVDYTEKYNDDERAIIEENYEYKTKEDEFIKSFNGSPEDLKSELNEFKNNYYKEHTRKMVNKGNFNNNKEVDFIEESGVSEDEYESIMALVGKEEVSYTSTEREFLLLLRAALKYCADTYEIEDYSQDSYLTTQYVLPFDIVLMKGINDYYVSLLKENKGKADTLISDTANKFKTSKLLVSDVINGEISRKDFRLKYFESAKLLFLNNLNDVATDRVVKNKE